MKRIIPYFFILPLLLLIFLFYIIPAVSTVYISATDMGRSLKGNFVGIKNFTRIFSVEDPVIGRVLLNTLVYLSGALIITIIGGLLLAIATTTLTNRWGSFFRIIWFLPRATPPVVWAFLWIWAFDPSRYGLLNMIFNQIGLQGRSWLTLYPMAIVILANGILGIPYTMTILSAALSNIPLEILEAAKIDGASGWRTAVTIKIPLIWWPLSFLIIWYTLSFLTSFQYILMITGGGPFYASTPLALYTYNKAFQNMELGYGSALALVLIALSVVIILAFRKLLGVKRET
ncbi:MAG: sugar ABC transporter permease [Spirochaetes bacterium]|nr:sugar ABC transporter permease [Spirochaetota bacterium]